MNPWFQRRKEIFKASSVAFFKESKVRGGGASDKERYRVSGVAARVCVGS